MSAALLPLLLTVGFRHRVTEDNAEAAFERMQALSGEKLDAAAFHAAVAAALADGLIRDPIRLEAGSLHCHWHLELTPAGVAAARALIARD